MVPEFIGDPGTSPSGTALTDPTQVVDAGLLVGTGYGFGQTTQHWSLTTTAATQVDRSPLRWIAVGQSNSFRAQVYRLGLDDQRPWRAMVLSNPTRIVIDIGGPTQSVSDRIAVYQPRVGAAVTRDLQVTGAGRTFEANVNWRLLDSTGREVASGTFMGGSGPLWGAFDTRIAIPTSVSGNVTLEVFEASAKDGSPQGVTQIPLTVR